MPNDLMKISATHLINTDCAGMLHSALLEPCISWSQLTFPVDAPAGRRTKESDTFYVKPGLSNHVQFRILGVSPQNPEATESKKMKMWCVPPGLHARPTPPIYGIMAYRGITRSVLPLRLSSGKGRKLLLSNPGSSKEIDR